MPSLGVTIPTRKKGIRSSIACTRCNAAKSKCDLSSVGSPCSRCKERKYHDCTPIQSRRGTYERKAGRRRRLSDVLNAPRGVEGSDSASASTSSTTLPVSNTATSPSITSNRTTEWMRSQLSLPSSASSSLSTGTIILAKSDLLPEEREPAELSFIDLARQPDEWCDDIVNLVDRSPREISLMQQPPNFHEASTEPSVINSHNIGGGAIKDTLNRVMQSCDAQQSKEWSLYFKSFFDNVAATAGKRTALYFGESFPVSWLLYHLQKIRGQIRIDRPRITEVYVPPGKHPPDMTEAKIIYLTSQACFVKPPSDVVDQLIAAYFQTVHNVYPIINRGEFMKLYKADRIPWLLFHSILFAASSHCPISLLCREDLNSTRREARMNFYRRAKSIFDLSYEKNKITLLQSALLLSFWGGPPDDYWNSISWINMAVNIAESLGMHRSMSSLDIADDERALWRRIWWCLVARDSFCASLQGKPLRINLSQCDVEQLVLTDFDSDCDPPGTHTWGARRIEHGLYVIENIKLSLILRAIVQARDTRCIDTEFVLDMHKELQTWEHQMPNELRVPVVSPESPLYVFCAALSLVYNHHLIYLHQTAPSECEISLSVAQEAVSNIAEFGSMLVTLSVIPFIPQDSLASFFMAIVMLFAQMQGQKSEERMRLFRMQLNICEMIVHQSQDHWDHADWILAISESLRQKLDFGCINSNNSDLPAQMLTVGVCRADDKVNTASGQGIVSKTSATEMDYDELVRNLDTPNFLAISPEGDTGLESLHLFSLLERYGSVVGP
ncbi:fungal-specific transcription factor domain-containing protein [Lipomyces doorenjongii]